MPTPPRPRIFPALRYRDAPAALAWLCDAFGFSSGAVHRSPDGTVGHAELHWGPNVIGLSSSGRISDANPWTAVRQGLYVCADDVDGLHARAFAAGATIVQPLHDTDYGSRDFTARDGGGHLWGFGTYDMHAGEGASNLFVGLHYTDGSDAIALLQGAFGFSHGLEIPGDAGAIAHAELHRGTDVVMLGSTPRAQGVWGDQVQMACVVESNPDRHHARAVEHGARIVQPPQDTPYGARGYTASDPEGFLWAFSTYRPAMSMA